MSCIIADIPLRYTQSISLEGEKTDCPVSSSLFIISCEPLRKLGLCVFQKSSMQGQEVTLEL